ncbi:septum formation initiator family protein [Tsukamurella sp. 8F]|uniref:FtsB family cell division protein n=1 Tax=unclassified Tsukamurella TaxID=2633480 RepID=UPI0023B97E7C|nr:MULTISPECIES: septum formation initiator family protein [unclassified Tsukamurella]MDF0530187.1 septum formation initiator family protein [Tsukamurella sp. 8J]MDF0586504.1 septum formation initiator family protein [Tsukamurella sp. 8F]
MSRSRIVTPGRTARAETSGARRALVLFVVVCLLGLTLAMPVRTYLSQQSQENQLAADHSRLVADINKLEAQKNLQSDPDYVKEQARLRLLYVMPGETPYRVQTPQAPAPTREEVQAQVARQSPWYTNVWRSIAVPH